VTLSLEVAPDAAGAAIRVAALIVERAREAAERGRVFSLALSKSPTELLRALHVADLAWRSIRVYQVDERVAPTGHADRNLTHILEELPAAARESIRPMPVEDPDLEAAAERYAAELPAQLDFVHLGLGADGHTASLVPGDPVLDVFDRLVAVTDEYQGRRRLTLTYPALDAAREIVWLVTDASKRKPLSRLLAGDFSIPAARVSNDCQRVVADRAAVEPR
jgi:6-phosphogluconolactonase